MGETSYAEWLKAKTAITRTVGVPEKDIAPGSYLSPFQRDLVRWSLLRGSSALFEGTGLGKTRQQLDWARHISKYGRVLGLAPLAVAQQTVLEGQRIGVDVRYCRKDEGHAITLTNYDMLDHFAPRAFAGVFLDESSILKSYDGATRNALIESFARTPFRLCCTATPAPNDYTELGNHSEFLGIKTRTEMLSEYFVHDGETTQEWRLKGHAQMAFWRWVASWGAIVRRPSDLGYDDGAYILPPLRMHERVIAVDHREAWKSGALLATEALSLSEQRAVRRATMAERVKVAAELAAVDEPVLLWCELNDEGDALAKAIPDAVQVAGSDSREDKEDRLLGFATGKYKKLISKTSIAGFGMNYQHCAREIFLGASHSYEQIYQALRRCWRFGQMRPVDAFILRAETDGAIVANYKRKDADARRMEEEIAPIVSESVRASIGAASREWNDYTPRKEIVLPSWLSSGDA